MRKQGFILLIILPLILLMCMVGGYFFVCQSREIYNVRRQIASIKAFWLAEAGVNKALYELKRNYSTWSGVTDVPLDGGKYSVSIGDPVAIDWKTTRRDIVSTGTISSGITIGNIYRKIEVSITKTIDISDNFFGKAICAPTIALTGNYTVNGDIVWSESLSPNPLTGGPGTYTGAPPVNDPSINPLPQFNFQQLQDIAVSQVRPGGEDNYFSAAELSGGPDFPEDFWYSPGVPNVVYVEGDLSLQGHDSVGGFFVVVGDVITDSADTGAATLNGNCSIDGCVYTNGKFSINGGGNALNVSGGIWADEAELIGHAKVSYNSAYQNVIKNLPDVYTYSIAISRWREIP